MARHAGKYGRLKISTGPLTLDETAQCILYKGLWIAVLHDKVSQMMSSYCNTRISLYQEELALKQRQRTAADQADAAHTPQPAAARKTGAPQLGACPLALCNNRTLPVRCDQSFCHAVG